MARNVKAAFGHGERVKKKPRTDFSEFHVPFTIKNGLFDTPKTTLISPFLRVKASGKADLVKETLDFRVEPKFVATLKGQGDLVDRKGIIVPVLVTGTFSSPRFLPDLGRLLKKRLEGRLPEEASELQKLLEKQKFGKGQPKPSRKAVEDLLKNLPFGK
jgi:AsmA protein